MPQYDPAAFHEVFSALTNLPIVGGMAVNLWAEIYTPRNASLDKFKPFLSKDADLFGERTAIIEKQIPTSWKARFFNLPREMAVGLLTKDLSDGEQMRVEILRSVHGLSPRDVQDAALVEINPGRVYRLPSPIVLLKAKIANTHDLVKKERPQDLKHVRMLVIICAHYLRDLHASVLAGATSERILINTLHALCTVIGTREAKTVATRHTVNFSAALPLDLPTSGLPKLAAFYANLSATATPRREKTRTKRR